MQRDDISILLMEEEQVAAVADLAKQCFSEPWSEAAYRSELRNPKALTMVALLDGKTVGFLNCGFAGGQADLNTVAVAQDYRRCGIARRLMTAMEQWLDGLADTVFLEVRCSNAAAQRLYRALGYAECGRRPRYYHAPDEDGLIMKKDLTGLERKEEKRNVHTRN